MSTTTSLYTSDNALVSRRPVTLTRGSQRSYVIEVFQNEISNNRTIRSAANLTGGVVRLAVVDLQTGEVVFEKTSETLGEIDFDTQSGATLGHAVINFIASDTETMDPEGCYCIEVWVTLANGDRDTIIDPSAFNVIERKTPINDSPAAPVAIDDPAPQTPQERSFLWTWTDTGDTDTVTIPLGGVMRDTSYGVQVTIVDVPAGGRVSVITSPSAGRTITTFALESAGDLLAGTTLYINARDIA